MQYSKKLAETLIERYPDPDSFPYKSWTYSQGFMLWGMVRLYTYTGDKKYYDYVMKYVNGHVDENGNIARFKGNSMDDMMTGSILVWAYTQTGEERLKLACKQIRDSFDVYPRNSDGGFWHGNRNNQMWVDGVFMGQMFMTKYGKFIGDEEHCFDEAAKQLMTIYKLCRKDNTGLLYHGFAENRDTKWADQKTGLSPEVWSEGLGWYSMMLVEALEIFPEDHKHINDIRRQLAELCVSLKQHVHKKEGIWCQVVDKEDNPDNWCDTSGSAMFLYTLMKAIELGVIEKDEYESCIRRAYSGMIKKSKLNDSGLLDIYEACDGLGVQVCYDDYINYKKSVNAKEAVAAFLWASTEFENTYINSKLFTILPEYVSTPDGMAIDSEGNLILACPNFADEQPGCIVKIDKDKNISKWFDVPVHPETGVARPMGIAFDNNFNLYICDNQGWSGKEELKCKGRILKISFLDNKIECRTVANGMEHPNGIRIKDSYMYVTQSLLEKERDETGNIMSCVYRFKLDDEGVNVTNTLADDNIIATFVTYNAECQYGADGIEFDSNGNLYIGNFGDGAVYRIRFDEQNNVIENIVWAQNPKELQSTDGIALGADGCLYVADFSANAIAKITPDGNVKRISQSPDTDGFDGELDQPGEPIYWNGKLVISCFDLVTGSDKVNTTHELPATLAEITVCQG